MMKIMDGIQFKYAHAVDELPITGGDYSGFHYSTYDIIYKFIGYEINPQSDAILEDIVDIMNDEVWCDKNPLGETDDEAAYWNWQTFWESWQRTTLRLQME